MFKTTINAHIPTDVALSTLKAGQIAIVTHVSDSHFKYLEGAAVILFAGPTTSRAVFLKSSNEGVVPYATDIRNLTDWLARPLQPGESITLEPTLQGLTPMLNMNPEVRTLWVEALRSGSYSQTHETLEDNRGFCCLGVLSKLAADRGICTRTVNEESGAITYDEKDGFLPEAVIRWAGLANDDPTLELSEAVLYGDEADNPNDMQVVSLAALNDEYRFTFQQIANIIEGKQS